MFDNDRLTGLPMDIASDGVGAHDAGPPRGHGTVYLAGPITHKTYTEARFGWRQFVARSLNPGIRVLSPMRNEGYLASWKGPINDTTLTANTSRFIVEKDLFDIRQSDVVLINLSGADQPARGSLVELGYARAMNKFIVLVIDEGSYHDYSFIRDNAGIVLYRIEDAVGVINGILSDGV